MSKKQKSFDDDKFFELAERLSKADQNKLLWRMRWIVFIDQFTKESIKRRFKKFTASFQPTWDRYKLKRIRHPITKEIDELWKKAQKDYRLKYSFKGKFSDIIEERNRENNHDLQAQVYLQPWLSIFDQGILWLTAFYFAFSEGDKPARKKLMPVEFLIGTACVQANAIRLLCEKGFDLPAKAVLRTFLETIISCIVIIYDEDLRRGYMKANNPYKSWKFWSKHLRERNLTDKLKEIFLAHGLDDKVITEFNDWINEEFGFTSEAVHPSYVATAFATHPFPLTGEILPLGILGTPSALSHRTLSTASRFLWFFSVVSVGFLLQPQKGRRKPLLTLKKRTDTSKIFAVSYSIYWELVQSHWNDKLD